MTARLDATRQAEKPEEILCAHLRRLQFLGRLYQLLLRSRAKAMTLVHLAFVHWSCSCGSVFISLVAV